MCLGFDCRKRGDSLRDIIFLRLLSLYSSYTSLIFIISLSLSLAKKHIYMMKGKTGIQPFPASGSPTAGFSLPLKCERRQQVAAYSSSEFPPIKKDTQGVYIKGIQPFPASGSPTAGFSLSLKCERRQQVAAYSSSEFPPIKKDTLCVFFYWRKRGDSNP